MNQVNIVVGRFQPFTKGHLACVEEAFTKKHLNTVLVMIETPESKVDKKHPFPSTLLLDIYKGLVKENHIDDIVLVKNADIVKIAGVLREKHYQIASWTCGTDRVNDYTRMAKNYGEKAGLAGNFEIIEVKRGDDDISATKVRQALTDDDFETFAKLTTFGKKEFDILQKQLKTVKENFMEIKPLTQYIKEETQSKEANVNESVALVFAVGLLTYAMWPTLESIWKSDIARSAQESMKKGFGKLFGSFKSIFKKKDKEEDDKSDKKEDIDFVSMAAAMAMKESERMSEEDRESFEKQAKTSLAIAQAQANGEFEGLSEEERKKKIGNMLPEGTSYEDWEKQQTTNISNTTKNETLVDDIDDVVKKTTPNQAEELIKTGQEVGKSEKTDKEDDTKKGEPKKEETVTIDGEEFTKKDGKLYDKDGNELQQDHEVTDNDGKKIKVALRVGPKGGKYYWPKGSPKDAEHKVYVQESLSERLNRLLG